MSDTSRTATEQLLLSTAIDRAINQMNFNVLAGKEVYFDNQYLKGTTDEHYIVSSMRQHLLASGVILKEDREDATYVVEARSGAVGTNRQEVMIGVPSVNVPNVGLPGAPSSIPEIPFAKTTDQRGVAKLAVYAYNQQTGMAVWQSGVFPITTTSKDTWILGSGPFQRGTIYDGTKFAGSRIRFFTPNEAEVPEDAAQKPEIPLTAEAVFIERPLVARGPDDSLSQAPTVDPDVKPTGHIIRLPALDEDLGAPTAPEQSPPPHPFPVADEALPMEPAADPAKFNLFNPKTWFGPSKPPHAGPDKSDG